MKRRWRIPGRLGTVVLVLLLGTSGGVAWAAFSSTTSSGPNSFSAAADFVAPTASTSVIAKTVGYLAGKIRQGGAYYVYANVTDTGNPASGVSTVTADVSAITTGSTAVALTSTGGPFSVNGVSYTYRSASVTANAVLAAAPYGYSLTMTDVAGNNSGPQSGFSVTVDNTVPTATDVQTANGGTIVGRAEQNDTITYTFSEQMDPDSILAGWTGASTNVVVRINNVGGGDIVQVYDATNTAQLPLGQVDLKKNYTSASITFGATGTASTMVQSGTNITMILGTQSAAGKTGAAASAMVWTPSATATDAAGNACSAANATESGAADVEF